jgi:phosphatidylinositol-4,5-bisphosphate 4-phosphatase
LGDLSPKGEDFGGKVGAFLESEAPQEQKDKVLALSRQVKDMWNDGSYMKMGHDPYKMVARLVVLSDMIGVAPMWNCKSGKDRTGMLDGEAKFLAARIELSGKVPEPGEPLTDEETAMYRQFMLRSGNLEMQQLNTGLGGFKTEGVKAIDERLGDPKAREIHRGASAAVQE